MNEHQISYTKCNDIGTILYVAIERKYVGYIIIADTIKEDSKNAINGLMKTMLNKQLCLQEIENK